MRPRILAAIAALVLGAHSSARAQSVVQQIGNDLKWAGGDVWSIWTSPFDAGRRDWLLALGAIGGSALLMPIDDDVDRWAVRNRNAGELSFLKELRRGGLVYGGNRFVPVIGGAYVLGLATNNRDIRDGIFGCMASYASGSVLRNYAIYKVVSRERPDSTRNRVDGVPPEPPAASEGDQYHFALFGDEGWGMHSTPGGHVANVAACATFLNSRFEMGFVEPLLYAVVGGVGVGRLLDRGHWTSDQVLGIIFGYAIGREVAHRQLKRLQRERGLGDRESTLELTHSAGGMRLGWTVKF